MQGKIVPDIVNNQHIELIAPSMTVREAAKRMTERHIGALLMGENGRLLGIFTERDILTRVVSKSLDPQTTLVEEVMTKNPDTVAPDERALTALERMQQKGYRHLPVADGDRVVGIVSIRDLYAGVKRGLETDLQEREAFIFDTGYGIG
jgi:CBS domain-containing protein